MGREGERVGGERGKRGEREGWGGREEWREGGRKSERDIWTL